MPTTILRACDICGAEYRTLATYVRRGRCLTCSPECGHKKRLLGQEIRITRECPTCGKSYEALKQVVARGRALHCSPACGARRRRNSNAMQLEANFWSSVRRTEDPAECWVWTGSIGRKGYGRIGIGNANPALAHRLAWTLTRGEIPAGLHVLHRCDNPPCCNPAHLFLGTNLDNIHDRMAKGRSRGGRNPQPRGADSPYSKLTADQRATIRGSAASIDDLARTFGVSRSTIFRLRRTTD